MVIMLKDSNYWIKFMTSVIGIAITCFSASLFYKINMGADPYQVFAIAVHKQLGISYGQANMLLNGIIVVFILFTKRKYLNVSLFLSLCISGPLIDLYNAWIGTAIQPDLSIYLKLLIIAAGILLLAFGIYLYIAPRLGASPADSVGLMISEATKVPYKRIRIVTDTLYTVVGLLLGGSLGIVTVLAVMLTGPCIGWMQKWLGEHRFMKYVTV
ncbi:YczE/YyaS/YitT family protein [Paenibacillus montanisoli]|uniref:YitT family protein n=1 Tax=Paenibacillus montanisoli TaxID=2081970 RepID=A0A328TW50_9BACL|nr:hypothetical protein [Paenibacillus montanisoli]RAP74727.1 hypothetical protein DL346_22060 [Paenibacillus montanisoli]